MCAAVRTHPENVQLSPIFWDNFSTRARSLVDNSSKLYTAVKIQIMNGHIYKPQIYISTKSSIKDFQCRLAFTN